MTYSLVADQLVVSRAGKRNVRARLRDAFVVNTIGDMNNMIDGSVVETIEQWNQATSVDATKHVFIGVHLIKDGEGEERVALIWTSKSQFGNLEKADLAYSGNVAATVDGKSLRSQHT